MEKPFERSYWINSNFLAGYYPGGTTDREMLFKLEQLKKVAVSFILACAMGVEYLSKGNLLRKRSVPVTSHND